MKIREVKIQAFKSYLKENDSTFDFSWEKDNSKVANLVSIFAPNGFGKTSFYDAVDFCYTNNITRYIRDDKTRIQNKKNATRQPFILRNLNADNEIEKLDTHVKIETEDQIKFTSPIIKHSQKGSDYKFDDNNTPNDRKYFRDLMLSQEAIDAFLRETNPVDRFKKFATKQVNDLSSLNDKRITISQLLTDIESNLRETKSQENEKKCELLLIDSDKDILAKINNAITKCNKLGIEILPLSEPYNTSKHQNLRMTVTDHIERLKNEERALEKQRGLLNSFVSEFSKLEESASELKVLNEEKNNLTALLSNLKLISKNKTLVKQFTEEKRNFEQELEKLNSYYSRVEEFYKLHNNKISLLQRGDKASRNKEILEKKITATSADIIKARKDIISQTEQLDTLKKLLSRIEPIFNGIESKSKEKELYNVKLNELEPKIIDAKRKISDCSEAITLLSSFSIDSLLEPNNLITKVVELNQLNNSFKDNRKLLTNLDLRIEDHKKELEKLKHQEANVSKLISLGHDLIHKNKSTNCPLCSQSYKDFDELKNSIESNKLIDSFSSSILKQISNLNEEKSELINRNAKLNSKYKALIAQEIEKYTKSMQLAETELSILQKDEKDYMKRVSDLDGSIDALKNESLFMTKKSFQEHVLSKLEETSKFLSEKRIKTQSLEQNLADLNRNQITLNESISRVFEEIGNIEQNEFYHSFTMLFDEYLIDISDGEKSTYNELKQCHEDVLVKLNKASSNIASEKQLGKELESKIYNNDASLSIEEIKDRIEKRELLGNEILSNFHRYQELFSSNFRYWLDLNAAKIDVDTSVKNIKNKIEQSTLKFDNLNVLTKLADEASSLSEGIKLQNELSQLEVQREGLGKLKAVLDTDIETIDSEIKSYIDDYFYVDLINELYNAIDPHPEFKSIKFEYVSNKNPELHIKVKGNSIDDTVAPALHFSSAQINVLSLSIFLAKALNTKSSSGEPANCIFIERL